MNPPREGRPRAFELRHVVGLADTNLLGNVYFTRHLEWQGRCREIFLREHCPEVVAELTNGLVLVTLACECRYLGELEAFDEVVVRMRLAGSTQSRLDLEFEYLRCEPGGGETLVAQGSQQIACMRRQENELRPTPVPAALREALAGYA